MTDIEKAQAVATDAHAGQVDLQGKPYVEHLSRVAAAVPDAIKPVAWLHDIFEDTSTTGTELVVDFPADVIASVEVLTRRDGENYDDYIMRVASSGDRAAILVKRADLHDNLRPGLEKISIALSTSLALRYRRALDVLSISVDTR